jgi:hypothetical protein
MLSSHATYNMYNNDFDGGIGDATTAGHSMY